MQSFIKGVPLLEHGLGDPVHCVGELVVQEPDVRLHQEVKVVGASAIVMSDGGLEADQSLLLLCDPGCQGPDHGGQPDAGGRGHG